MEKNFIVDKAVYMLSQEKCYDLHNNYYFHECLVRPQKGVVILTWLKLNREWVKFEEPIEFAINFQNVTFFEISDSILVERISQLQEIGYKHPDDKNLDWLNNETNFSKNSHMIFRFENDEYIRIHSDFAEVKTSAKFL